jgi:protein-tyrosine-phosphatase
MAEVLFRDLIKSRADYTVASAGVYAMDGQRASENTQAVLKDEKLDGSKFRSQRLSKALVCHDPGAPGCGGKSVSTGC